MKFILSFVFSILLFSACSKSDRTDNSTNENLVKEYFGFFNQHKWNEMANLYADSAEFRDPSFGAEIVYQNKEEIVKKYAELAEVFPDIQDKVTATYHSGEDHIIVEFISTGTGPDSMKLELPICTIFKIKGGKITQDFTYYDNSEE